MKIRFGASLVTLLFVVIFISSMIGYIFGVRAMRAKPSPQKATFPMMLTKTPSPALDDALSVITSDNTITQTYILKEKDGVVSLYSQYSDGREHLHQSYDISVNLLPQSDRELLKKGIKTDTLSDALQLVEDYTS